MTSADRRSPARTFAPLLAAALAVGCASGHGGGGPSDAAPREDAAPPPIDGAVVDAAVPDAGEPDAGPPDPRPHEGISWPDAQQFPTFAVVGPLDVTTAVGRAPDMATLLVTLQGVVNRKVPRIYVPHGGTADELWLHELGVATTVVDDPLALVAKYKDELAGVVIYDDALPDTLNLATTIAGLRNAVVSSPALAATLTGAPYGLPVVADLRGNHFTSRLAVYQYELDNFASSCNHRMIIGLTPGIPGNLRDYAVATRSMMVWLDPGVPAERALLDRFLSLLPPNSPYLGWWPDEGAGVNIAASHGVPVYAADWSRNLTVLGGSARGRAPMPVAPPPPPLENKLYVAIFMSDGDNLQEDQGLIPLKWAHGRRGEVPIAWTISPALVDVAPVILRYFQRTATDRDVLVSGPSGLGYTYPARWPGNTFVDYARQSGAYMEAAGLTIATLWNDRVELTDDQARAYVDHVPGLAGLTIQDTATPLRMIDDRVPLVRMDLSYGDTAAILERGVDEARNGFVGAAPRFVAIQGNMNMGTIHPDAFHEVQEHYAADTRIVFVRPDHYFQLMVAANRRPGHVLLDGDWNGDGKADQAFYYGGNGDWWFGLSDGATLTWHRAGNTGDIGNWTDGRHAFYTGDIDGDHKTDAIVYDGNDQRWRIGRSDGDALTWRLLSPGNGVANLLDGRHRVSIGDYDGDGKSDVLVYSAADGSWRLGAADGGALTWRLLGNTGGFGDLLDGSHAFFDGDWNGDGRRDVLFFYNGDGNWWMGVSSGTALSWHLAGNGNSFGNLIDRSHRVLVGDWNGDRRSDLLFHYNGDDNWWMGIGDGDGFAWHLAAQTSHDVDLLDLRHRIYVGDHDGDGRSDVLVYDSGRGDWSVGRSNGSELTWQTFDNSRDLGDLADRSRRLVLGDFDGDRRTDALIYYKGDGNWWLRRAAPTPIGWRQAGNTSGFGNLLE